MTQKSMFQSECELENQLILQLEDLGYEKIKIRDVNELNKNFREQLNKFNKNKLDGKCITDKEFERVCNHLKGKKVYVSSLNLRDKFVLEREDGTNVYLSFFDSDNYSNNIYQVTNQVTMEGRYKNRYDVTILINGLPVVQIELKRRGGDFKEAFNQIERYRRNSLFDLYRYIQCFVISNGVDTKYYSNVDGDTKFDFTFFWTDENNNRYSNLSEFCDSFLDKYRLHSLIAKYMIIRESGTMIMRPYQIYAVEALLRRAKETNNNGYIWHTTGSGKTLTSFKASQLLSNEESIKKVFFLIDRKDLDSQTVDEFNKFKKDCVDRTDNVGVLIRQIEDINSKLIVTTIQKLSRLLKSEHYSKRMDKYKEEKVVFIIDECHRSQYGEMHTAINKHFQNAQYFGFTGTPRLLENKSQDGRTSSDIFDKCLHSYLIKDAINDGNVLGFSVEYIKTFDGYVDEYDDERVEAIDKNEVFMADERIELIAKHIIENHYKKTNNGKFCALLTVESIPALVKYYDTFKKLDHDLKIAGIFSFADNEDLENKKEHSRESLERIIQDFNNMYPSEKLNLSTDNFSSYFKTVCNKIKKDVGRKLNLNTRDELQIDILIVVNMFLTGFDSKYLNTLYVDKNLKYHGLVQAFSRTNRILDSTKPYGNIVCYRNLKKQTDEAIRLFSNTNTVDVVLMEGFTHYLNDFKKRLAVLYSIVENPEDVDKLEDENRKKEFVEAFRELTKVLFKLKTFTEFEFDEEILGISQQKYEDLKSKYLGIYDSVKKSEKKSILSELDFIIELMHTDRINISYILELLRSIDFETEEKIERDIENIKNILNKTDNDNLRLKADLIKEFLDKVVPKMSKDSSVDEYYNTFMDEKRLEEIRNIANESKVDFDLIKKFIDDFDYFGKIDTRIIKDSISGGILEKKRLSKKIEDFIKEHVSKFNQS